MRNAAMFAAVGAFAASCLATIIVLGRLERAGQGGGLPSLFAFFPIGTSGFTLLAIVLRTRPWVMSVFIGAHFGFVVIGLFSIGIFFAVQAHVLMIAGILFFGAAGDVWDAAPSVIALPFGAAAVTEIVLWTGAIASRSAGTTTIGHEGLHLLALSVLLVSAALLVPAIAIARVRRVIRKPG